MKRTLLILSAVAAVFSSCQRRTIFDVDNLADSYLPDDLTLSIQFQDSEVESISLQRWDRDGNGEISYEEASLVKNLGDAFTGKDIQIFDELKYFTGLETITERAFENCDKLFFVTLPTQITKIEDYAFGGCKSIENISIYNNVTKIGNGAFYGCESLKMVVLPYNIYSIGHYAFSECSSLKSVYCRSKVPPIGGYHMFYGNDRDRVIYVHHRSVLRYRSERQWSTYDSQIVGFK